MRVPNLKFQQDDSARVKGQTAIEYLLLLAAVVVVVLVAFKQLLPVNRDYANVFFNKAATGIMGNQAGCYLDEAGNKWYKARTGLTNYP